MPRILLIVSLCLLYRTAFPGQVLWDAASALTPAGAAMWQPKVASKAPPAQPMAGSIALSVPAKTESDRLAWDLICALPYQQNACLELEFTLDHPAAVRQISVYFAQGNGWRTASIPLLHRGWNRVVLPLSRFTSEGASSPCQSTLFRLAIYTTKTDAATVQIHTLRVEVPDVLLLQGISSFMNASERAQSLRTANLLTDWLSDAGISHAILGDNDLHSGIASAVRVLILGAVQKANPPTISASKTLLERGGKLMVCGSHDRDLASLLNMDLQTSMQTTAFGTFASFVLPGSGGQTTVIHDHNWEITPAKPRPGAGKVTALWQDARGRSRYETALSTTKEGWWFAFPFHAGDQRRKQDLLVKLIAEVSPASLADAARTRLHRARRAGPYLGVGELRAAAGGLDAGRRNALETILSQAAAAETSARETLQRNLFSHAYSAAARLENRLENAYALLQSPGKASELRGVWDHNGVGLYPGGWDATCKTLAEHGFNAVFPNLMWSGKAHFRSRNLPASKTCEQFGDQLTACVDAATKHGLKVHVWKICWQLGGTDSPLYETFKSRGRLQKNLAGETIPWLCPSQLENLNWEVSTVSEVARRAGIAGIHLDYVRYPEGGGCFCEHTRAAFERYLERPVKSWPRDAAPRGVDAALFAKFRADEISRFVGRVYSTVKGINPKLQVSAAVWGRYPECIDSVAQDWARWLREGTIDFVTPMNYTQDAHEFGSWIDAQLSLDESAGKIIPGIGAISTECELAPDEIMEQIQITRKRKLPGYVLFKLDAVLAERDLPYLRLAQ